MSKKNNSKPKKTNNKKITTKDQDEEKAKEEVVPQDVANQNQEEEEGVEPVEEEYDEDDSFGDNDNEIDDEDEEMDDKEDEAGAEDYDEMGEEVTADADGDTCIYKYEEGSDEDEDDEVIFDDDNEEVISEIMPSDKRRTKPILFKYERVRLIGDRTQQLTLGAKPMVKNIEGLTAKEIAELELKLNVIPIIIQRPLPNGKKERWHISELAH